MKKENHRRNIEKERKIEKERNRIPEGRRNKRNKVKSSIRGNVRFKCK